jgi:hypothetical protein
VLFHGRFFEVVAIACGIEQNEWSRNQKGYGVDPRKDFAMEGRRIHARQR